MIETPGAKIKEKFEKSKRPRGGWGRAGQKRLARVQVLHLISDNDEAVAVGEGIDALTFPETDPVLDQSQFHNSFSQMLGSLTDIQNKGVDILKRISRMRRKLVVLEGEATKAEQRRMEAERSTEIILKENVHMHERMMEGEKEFQV